jgi:hypothetical protein
VAKTMHLPTEAMSAKAASSFRQLIASTSCEVHDAPSGVPCWGPPTTGYCGARIARAAKLRTRPTRVAGR